MSDHQQNRARAKLARRTVENAVGDETTGVDWLAVDRSDRLAVASINAGPAISMFSKMRRYTRTETVGRPSVVRYPCFAHIVGGFGSCVISLFGSRSELVQLASL